MNLGVTLLMAGRVDAAVRQFEETLELDSNFSMAHVMLGLAYVRKGMPERAVAAAQKARALAGSRPDVIALPWLHLGAGGAEGRGADDPRRSPAARGAAEGRRRS